MKDQLQLSEIVLITWASTLASWIYANIEWIKKAITYVLIYCVGGLSRNNKLSEARKAHIWEAITHGQWQPIDDDWKRSESIF